MLEKTIEKKVTAYAKERGWISHKWASPARRGVPDRLFIKSGQVVAVEFKRPGAQPTRLQSKIMRELSIEGLPCYVIDSVGAGVRLFA